MVAERFLLLCVEERGSRDGVEGHGFSLRTKLFSYTAFVGDGQEATAVIEVSDDAKTVKDSTTLSLRTAEASTTRIDITSLKPARYIRVRTQLATQDSTSSPYVDTYVFTVDPVPELRGEVSPTEGEVGDIFTFRLTYKDPDGDPPVSGYPTVSVDNENYAMVKQSGEYGSGATYTYSTASLKPGLHSFYFVAYDGTTLARLPETGSLPGPRVFIRTYLQVSPSTFSIRAGEKITLKASLKDKDGNPLAGRRISWRASEGRIEEVSSTDARGESTVTYFAPDKAENVTITAAFEGDDYYKPATSNVLASIKPPLIPSWLLPALAVIGVVILSFGILRKAKQRKKQVTREGQIPKTPQKE